MFTLVTCRLSIDRHYRPTLDRHLGEIATDTWSSVGRHVLQVGRPSVATIGRYLVGVSVYTRPTPRPLCYDELLAAYRWTVGGISVDIWWYKYCVLLTVCFAAETGDAKEQYLSPAHIWG